MVDSGKVEEVLRGAQAAVEAAEVATEFRAIAYEKAVELLAAGAGLAAPAAAASASPPPPAAPAGGQSDGGPTSGSLQRIATQLEVDLELVERAYEVQDGDLAVVVPVSRLPQQARPAMRDLIVLTAVGRQAGGWDASPTPVAAVRAVCESYSSRFDAGNFANAVRDLSDYLRRQGGRRRDATVRVLPGGYRHAAERLRELFGDST